MKDAENLYLMVNILNKYIYFFMGDIEVITAGDINKLIELVKENIKDITEEGKVDKAKKSIKSFNNTLDALKGKMKENPSKFENIILE
eukprot:CAMPEP_0205833490 /NCGR_PEP_ID=MMETSP0206-20130828/49890_1 /ASSEMBLY_ACC=CAM_ASM_000279 /TAXON_ID=36767 /ORGANISM="Euplotes focardii, Strain TN1" /LENGTH=87 /DNA_ID=CAMNT_0053139951 /DNA_START=311 /DNA_END=574 /DNA_ORIENTATION=-